MEHYVIVIGAMKAGTTTLFSLLAQHPAIAPVEPKEPGFFAFPYLFAKGFSWYHSLFSYDEQVHTYRLDGSTDYTKEPYVTDVWARMKSRENAQFKLIYIVRDPVDRMESHARHVQRTRKELGQIISDRPDHSLDEGVSPVSVAISQYANQLDAFREPHQAGDLLITSLDELKNQPAVVMENVWKFLELDPVVQNETAPQHNSGAEKRTEVSGVWQKLTSNQQVLSVFKSILSKEMRAKIKAKFTKPVEVKGRFKFTSAERAKYYDLFADDMGRLKSEYSVTLARKSDGDR